MFLTGWRVGGRAEYLLVLSVALESAGDARETARARMSSIMLRRR